MRQFYLGRNSSGYYRVYFIDPVTGIRDSGKSTHTKDKVEATMIATSWLQNGAPDCRSNSRAFSNPTSLIPINLKNMVEHLSEDDARIVFSLLSEKFSFTTSSTQLSQSQNQSKSKTQNESGIKLSEFLISFWDYETSDFIKRYLAITTMKPSTTLC